MNISDLFYPRTKFEVLRTLFYTDTPVPLREISYRSNLVVGSVQTALKTLLREKIVSRENRNNRTYYRLSNLRVKEGLSKILKVLESFQLHEQTKSIQHRATNLLSQLEERNRIISNARRSLKP